MTRLVRYNPMEFSLLRGHQAVAEGVHSSCGRCLMLACNRLRVDPCDGSPVVDYRIENGCIESRTFGTAAETGTATEMQWHRLTPEQLSTHVMADTVVVHWLRRRMGVHRLVQLCTSSANNGVQECSERSAA